MGKPAMMKKLPGASKQFAASLLLNMLGGTLIILEAVCLADIVDKAFLGGGGLPSLSLPLSLLLGVLACRAIVHGISEHVSAKLALRMKDDLRGRLVRKLAELGPHYAQGERSGELISTVTEGVEQLEVYYAKYIPQLAQTMFIPLAIGGVVLGVDWFSAIILAVTMPLLILFMILVGMTAKVKADRQYRTLGRLSGHLHDVLRGLTTLTIFNRSKAQIGIISRMSEAHRKATMGTLRLAFLSAFVLELFATLSTAVVAVFLGLRLIEGQIGFEFAYLVLLLTPEFYLPVRALGTQFHSSTNGLSAADRIYAILEAEPPGYADREDGVRLMERREGYRIVFDRVSVRYAEEKEFALHDVSFTWEPGEHVALIGPTGAGKSTILSLLQGFIRPSEGRITVDGVDLAELSMSWWRQQLAVLAQRVHLFPGTVADNIRLADTGATDQRVIEAAVTAQADAWIRMLPDGYDTQLGESARLSGGQAQRIGLARALLKDAPLTLFDEPTSGLDRDSEEALRLALARGLTGRMALTVAHRLESVQSADRIIVLEHGRVAEIGSPAELAAADGLYAAMLGTRRKDSRAAYAPGEALVREAALYRNASDSSGEDAEGHVGATSLGTSFLGTSSLGQSVHSDNTRLSSYELRRVLRLLLSFIRPYKLRLSLAALLGFLTVAGNIGLMGTSGYLIAKAALRPETVLLLWIPIVGVRFFGITRGVFRYLERLVSHDLTFRILHRIRVWVYERLEPRGALLLEEKRSGDLLGSIIGDVEHLQNLYLRVLAPPLIAMLTIVLGFGVMTAHHPLLGVVLLVMMVSAGAGIPWISHRLGKRAGGRYVEAKGALYTELSDYISGLSEQIVFGQAGAAAERLGRLNREAGSFQSVQNRLAAWTGGGMTAITRLAMWLILIVAVGLTEAGKLDGVAIAALTVMAVACFEAIIPLPQAFQFFGQTAAAAQRLIRLTDQTAAGYDEAATAQERSDGGGQGEEMPACSLEVQHMYFRYQAKEHDALNDISLSLVPGRRIAVVGESGAGKSTLLHLLLKLREPDAGKISLHGKPWTELTAEQVREQFSVVSQQVQLFNATVADNLRLGNPAATMAQMRKAARMALIEETIDALPDGFQTVIGEWGSTLSGGEKQRLALARALLRDAPFVLFDEPATGLDVLTEQALLRNLEEGLADKGVLWITHRLTGLERMDEIIVLHRGRVVERGTHAQLLARGGEYAHLWRLEHVFALEKATEKASVG